MKNRGKVSLCNLLVVVLAAMFAAAACTSGSSITIDATEEVDGNDTLPDEIDDQPVDQIDDRPEDQADVTDVTDVTDGEEACDPGLVLCGDKCVDTETDPEHCGGCYSTCSAPDHAGPVCEGGECGWSCLAGWVNADGNDDNGCECEQIGTNETECGDGVDNDCDGAVDCADSDCEGISCGENGMICASGSCVCSRGEPPETECGDGVDNDCDGLVDCADSDCSDRSCGEATDLCCGTECVDTLSNFYHCGICGNDCDAGQVCNGGICMADCSPGLTDCGGSCVDTDTDVDHCSECFIPCPPRDNATRTCTDGVCGFTCAMNYFDIDGDELNGCECHRTQSSESACGDLTDNDCDGVVDCADTDCDGLACSGTGRICSGGACICPGGEVNEETCNDSADNDCDGLADCADPDCDGDSCGPYGRVCTGFACVCPGGELIESTCGDAADNDCDGTIDCADTDCADLSCGGVGDICCSLSCVDTNTNGSHCGGCNDPCGPTESCVDGACVTTCTHDCESGERRCDPDGLNGYQLCGSFDLDPCLDWSTTTLCAGATICYAGQCINPAPPGFVIINEVLYDGDSTDEDDVFIELWGEPGLHLGNYNLVGINGHNGLEYVRIDLFGMTIPDDGYFVIVHPSAGASLLAEADMQHVDADIQNGPDSIQLRWGEADVLDALGYGDSGVNFAGEGGYAPDVSPGSSLSRNRAHWDTDDNFTDFHANSIPTPGRNDDPAYSISSVPAGFVDISATGTDTSIVGDDNYTTTTVGFDFPFFGNVYNTVLIHGNGFLSFDLPGGSWYINQNFPNDWNPNDVVACFWDDLYMSDTAPSRIYYELFSAAVDPHLVVQYQSLEFFSDPRNPATLTFEIIIYESGNIECQYHEMTSLPDPAWATGGSATVGLENVDASDFLLHSYNDPSGVFSPGGLLFTPI